MIKNLLKADLRAILRNPKWIAISILLIVILSLTSLLSLPEETYLQWAYFYIPVFLTVFTSTFIVGERKSGFISSVFTSPVSKRDYIMEKFLLGLCIGSIYLAMTFPISVLHIIYSGSGFALLFLCYLLSAIILIAFSSALGLFISVLSNKDEVMAILLGFVFCVVSLGMVGMFIKSLMGAMSMNMLPQFVSLYIYHFSPSVCIMDFLNTHYAFQVGNTITSLIVPVLFTMIFLVSSYAVFKKLQNPGGNDFRMGKAVPIAILIVLLLLIPPMMGNTSYSAREVNRNEINAWSNLIIGGGGGVYLNHPGSTSIVWWGDPVEIYLTTSKVRPIHNVTITFLSPKTLDIERFGNQRFVEFKPQELHFEELEAENVGNDSYRSFCVEIDLPSTKVGKGFYYVVVSLSSDEYETDYYQTVGIYNGWSVISLFIITLLSIAVLRWIFWSETKRQKIIGVSTKKMV